MLFKKTCHFKAYKMWTYSDLQKTKQKKQHKKNCLLEEIFFVKVWKCVYLVSQPNNHISAGGSIKEKLNTWRRRNNTHVPDSLSALQIILYYFFQSIFRNIYFLVWSLKTNSLISNGIIIFHNIYFTFRKWNLY